MRGLGRRRAGWFVGTLMMLAGGAAHAQLLPLQSGDVMPGGGCRFTEEGVKSAPVLMQWSWVGARQAAVRDGKQVYWLDLQNEKYFPEKRQPPRYGDRMVLFFADMNWRIQVVGSVVEACAPRAKSCSGATYKARLIVQSGAGKRDEIDVTGHCGG